ncbi:MAG TPA: Ig-like domain-containing protein [Acidimicrobiales bacterium]|jgi:hypothetical protein|nr:Ig-like domain-containing protein [Acidimicrobiales bacterium]
MRASFHSAGRAVLLVVGLLVTSAAGVVATATPASAFFPHNTFTFSPASGPPGTVISVSGLCNISFDGTLPPTVGSGATNVLVGLSLSNTNPTLVDIPVSANGTSWAGTITVPVGSPSGSYELIADCLRANGTSSGDYPYDPEFFQVLGSTVPTVTLTSSANPSQYSQVLTYTARVSGPAGAPTGNLTETVDGSSVGTVTVPANGVITFTVPVAGGSPLTVSTHAVSVSYSGDGTYVPGTAGLNQVVTAAPTSLIFVGGPATIPFGQTAIVTLKAAFSQPGVGLPAAPGGLVTITTDGQTIIAVAEVDPTTGLATESVSGLQPGPYVLSATLSGPGLVASTATRGLTVTPTSSTSLKASANPGLPGQPVTFTATVAPLAPATGTPTGLVVFSVDGTPVTTGITLVGGKAASGPLALSQGSHLVSAAYSGSGSTYSPSAGTLIESVQQVKTTLSAVPVLQSLPNLRATLSAAGAPLAGQTVIFSTPAGHIICSGVTNAAGTVTCAGGAQAVLSFGYVVFYLGSAAYLPASASGAVF